MHVVGAVISASLRLGLGGVERALECMLVGWGRMGWDGGPFAAFATR